MAFQAPLHVQRLFSPHQGHLIHSPVAGGAADAFLDVNAVVEIDEIWQVVDSAPLQRLAGPKTGPHRFQHGAIGPNLGVTGHADFGGGDAGERRRLYRGVAIAAVDSHAAHMVFMAERHRLFAGNSGLRHIRGPFDDSGHPDEPADNKYGAKDACLGERVRAWVEYLSHGSALGATSQSTEAQTEFQQDTLVPDFEAHKPPKGACTADAVYSCRTGKSKPTLGLPEGIFGKPEVGASDRRAEALECS